MSLVIHSETFCAQCTSCGRNAKKQQCNAIKKIARNRQKSCFLVCYGFITGCYSILQIITSHQYLFFLLVFIQK